MLFPGKEEKEILKSLCVQKINIASSNIRLLPDNRLNQKNVPTTRNYITEVKESIMNN